MQSINSWTKFRFIGTLKNRTLRVDLHDNHESLHHIKDLNKGLV